MQYSDFIPQNVAPAGAKWIGVYNDQGNRVGMIPLGKLSVPDTGRRLYTFGAVSDIHLRYSTAQEDFQRALNWFNEDQAVAFTCIAGDLTQNGTAAELEEYRTAVANWSPDTPVYAISGNHEAYGGLELESVIGEYTGHPLYYSFRQGEDLFVMVGVKADAEGQLFTRAELQWLYETLEANRNRRCFVFTHVRPQDGCGNAFGIYSNDIWGGTEAEVFESLMRHYTNVLLFHGHSHLKFYLQYGSAIANYDSLFGCHSIHIPSLAVPRDGDASGASSRKEIYADSEGYVVEVYEKGVFLRGRDFVANAWVPVASYWLDTTPVEIPEKTYKDPTATITV